MLKIVFDHKLQHDLSFYFQVKRIRMSQNLLVTWQAKRDECPDTTLHIASAIIEYYVRDFIFLLFYAAS